MSESVCDMRLPEMCLPAKDGKFQLREVVQGQNLVMTTLVRASVSYLHGACDEEATCLRHDPFYKRCRHAMRVLPLCLLLLVWASYTPLLHAAGHEA